MSKLLLPEDLELGKRIRDKRKIAGLTQKDLAEYLGVSIQQVQKYESGKNRISAISMINLENFIASQNKNSYVQEFVKSDGLSSSSTSSSPLLDVFDSLTSVQQEALKNFLLTMLNSKNNPTS